ncbi:MAG: hypothetical protein ACK419_06255, partial [Pyrinomonadaceae bacterium]
MRKSIGKFLPSKLRLCLLWLLILALGINFGLLAHEGEEHAEDSKTKPQAKESIKIASAERNIETENGHFRITMKRSPSDPRTSETVNFAVRITEKIEGGFGSDSELPIDNAKLSVTVSESEKGIIEAENLAVKAEGDGIYRFSYVFSSVGNYKITLQVTTEDNRQFTVDFPLSVSSAPMNSYFWLGLVTLILLCFGLIGVFFYSFRKNGGLNTVRAVRIVALGILLFVASVLLLSYFFPLQQARNIPEIPLAQVKEIPLNALNETATVTLPKETQLLFGIKTETISERKIRAGLKVNGIVKAKPESRAVITASVTGKVIFNQGIGLGSVVGRNQPIGTIEQVLDVSNQATLESQRLEIEAQRREVEIKQLELKNTILQLQSQLANQ